MESSVYSPLDEFHSLVDGPPPADTEMLNDANANELSFESTFRMT